MFLIGPMRILIIIVFTLVFGQLKAQETEDDLVFGTTEKTSDEPTYDSKGKEIPLEKIRFIYKKNGKRFLSDNKCFEDYTLSIGFQYQIATEGKPVMRNGFLRSMHNLGVKTTMMFKNGPFWGFKVRRQKRRCRENIQRM